MLFSVVDDRSGTSYQEYRCVYGEDVENELRFLFNAMAPKDGDGPALQGKGYPTSDRCVQQGRNRSRGIGAFGVCCA